MTVHSLHIFDRKGKTLFTKRFVKETTATATTDGETAIDSERLAEQRKLVFGMLFSLREVISSLSPSLPSVEATSNATTNTATTTTTNTTAAVSAAGKNKTTTAVVGGAGGGGLYSIRTGASTLYHYETTSGLRFALYVAHTSVVAADGSSVVVADGGAYNNPSDLLSSVVAGTTAPAMTTGGGGGAATNMPQQQPIHAPETSIRAALEYIYHELWIQCVTRSPLYTPTCPNVAETNFETKLTSFLRAQPWFR